MKKINLDLQFKTLDDKTIVISENKINKPLTLKFVLLNILGTYQAADGVESITVYDVGIKINRAKESIDLEDVEYELIKKVVNTNKLFVSIVTAQILKEFKKLEENKEG
uniref:Uncharacterized protein n=1 Tax=viral metagenome TaxID=1070528 RepID=A0A6M3IRM1_9ZZZZ